MALLAVDTNVLLRVFINDDELQHAASKRLIAQSAKAGHRIFIAVPVLCELVWVLQARHKLGREACVALLDGLLDNALFLVDQVNVVRAALARFGAQPGGFSDYLIAEIAAANGAKPVYSNDRALLKSSGFAKP
ncbi:MAG: type II toxin-antitoxin system VapC family toxin [Stagnimonas sp.]|nr:type II toxin-antitoxin system VapC family toxin [Stagnimonas sp.]